MHVCYAVALVGCVDGFTGSNLQIDLSPATPVQASQGATPSAGEIAANSHFRIYGIETVDGVDRLFELQRFEVHKIVDLQSPCFIDLPPNVAFPGIHVSQFGIAVAEDTGISDIANPPPGATEQQMIDAATAIKRMENIAALGGERGIKVVTSASESTYPPVDADCNGTGLPPPECRDTESNARRLEICRQAWADDPGLWEGTDRVLTAPLAGTTFGMVVGVNPVSPTPLGGAQFFVDEALAGIEQYAIFIQADGSTEPETLFLTGRSTATTRGVRHVHMTSPLFPNIATAELVVFPNLGEDDVHF